MAFPVVRVCVTVVGLAQSSFLCAQVSGYCCNLCVCRYMWSEFYRAWWLGHLDQFLECFSVFSHPLPFIIITLLLLSLIDLFRLYILFSQYRSCDDTQEIWSFVLFIKKNKCKLEYALFNEQDKGSNLLTIITWSVLGKQNVQAKKVYWSWQLVDSLQVEIIYS